jgi:hypothetical protein
MEGINEELKFHLVNWSKICSPKQIGELGVRNFTQFNQALLGKWLWRYATEREALWSLVIEAKYNSMSRGWCFKEVRDTFWSWSVETY